MVAEYRASVEHHGPVSAFGPFRFQRVTFTDSLGGQVTVWSGGTDRHWGSHRKARTRAHALMYWLRSECRRRFWEVTHGYGWWR